AEPASGAPPTFTGDELVAVTGGPDEDGLEDSHLTDRVGQRAEGLLVEVVARLIRVGPDGGDRDLLETRAGRRARGRAPRRDQRAESPTEPALTRHGSPPWPARGTRWRLARSGRTR